MQTLTFKSVALQLAVVAIVVAGLLSFTAPARASGLTETQIQAIINLVASFGADQATLSNVTTALRGGAHAGSGSTSGSGGSCHTFNSDLKFGGSATGDSDLGSLQNILVQDEGFQITGEITNGSVSVRDFGPSTLAAVKKFQAKYGISQTGYVGPLTRAKLNQLYGCH